MANPASKEKSLNFVKWVYLIKCNDGSFYTGSSRNPVERLRQHIAGKGAKFLNRTGKRPFRMFLIEEFFDNFKCMEFEKKLKTYSSSEKNDMLEGADEVLAGLNPDQKKRGGSLDGEKSVLAAEGK